MKKMDRKYYMKKIAFITALMMVSSLAVPAPYGVYAAEENSTIEEGGNAAAGEIQNAADEVTEEDGQIPDGVQESGDSHVSGGGQEPGAIQETDNSREPADSQEAEDAAQPEEEQKPEDDAQPEEGQKPEEGEARNRKKEKNQDIIWKETA